MEYCRKMRHDHHHHRQDIPAIVSCRIPSINQSHHVTSRNNNHLDSKHKLDILYTISLLLSRADPCVVLYCAKARNILVHPPTTTPHCTVPQPDTAPQCPRQCMSSRRLSSPRSSTPRALLWQTVSTCLPCVICHLLSSKQSYLLTALQLNPHYIHTRTHTDLPKSTPTGAAHAKPSPPSTSNSPPSSRGQTRSHSPKSMSTTNSRSPRPTASPPCPPS